MDSRTRWSKAWQSTSVIGSWRHDFAGFLVVALPTWLALNVWGSKGSPTDELIAVAVSLVVVFIVRPLAAFAWNYALVPFHDLQADVKDLRQQLDRAPAQPPAETAVPVLRDPLRDDPTRDEAAADLADELRGNQVLLRRSKDTGFYRWDFALDMGEWERLKRHLSRLGMKQERAEVGNAYTRMASLLDAIHPKLNNGAEVGAEDDLDGVLDAVDAALASLAPYL